MTEDFDFSNGLPSSEMEAYLQLFLDETTEQLDALVESLLILEQEPENRAQLNEAFRLIHSIKGSAAMMGLESITVLTHRLENHFERLRSGLETLHPETMSLILKCIDFLRHCNDRLRKGQPLGNASELLEELGRVTEASAAESHPTPTATEPPPARGEVIDAPSPPLEMEIRHVRVSVLFEPELPLIEVKAELIWSRLSELGEVLASNPSSSEVSRLSETCLLQFVMSSDRDCDELRMAADIGGVKRIAVEEGITDFAEMEFRDEAPAVSSDEMFEPADEEKQSEVTAVPRAPGSESQPVETTTASIAAPSETIEPKSKVAETLRVDVDRLDSLMNLAGELVVNQARFVQIARFMSPAFKKSNLAARSRALGERFHKALQGLEAAEVTGLRTDGSARSHRLAELEAEIGAFEEQSLLWEESRRQFAQFTDAIDQLARISRSLQRAVLDTRMVPVAPLFNRFRRVVRDISAELEKQVELEIHGENTELDKRMIDELNDPLVHLVRNSIDHGIESADVRRRRGKPEKGTVRLEAAHSGNHVLISVADDGGGIDLDRIRERMMQRGLVSPAVVEQLSDEQVIDYIWHPGFSTAAAVSDISGRGVGMDIVKTKIAGLNGNVTIDHVPDRGTTFTIRLPLTLAIIRSLLFRLRDGIFAVPIESVREIVAVPVDQVVSILGKQTIEVRGTFIPLVDIDDVFDWHDAAQRVSERQLPIGFASGSHSLNVVVLSSANRTIGLRVDELLGGQDIVIKSLSENFVQSRGLAGASILCDGAVCLLLDVAATIALASSERGKSSPRHRHLVTT